jgi:hypothetical protein
VGQAVEEGGRALQLLRDGARGRNFAGGRRQVGGSSRLRLGKDGWCKLGRCRRKTTDFQWSWAEIGNGIQKCVSILAAALLNFNQRRFCKFGLKDWLQNLNFISKRI